MTVAYEIKQIPINVVTQNFGHKIHGGKKIFYASPEALDVLRFNNLLLKQSIPGENTVRKVFVNDDKEMAYYNSLGIQHIEAVSDIGNVALLSLAKAYASKIEKNYRKIEVSGFDKDVYASRSALDVLVDENIFDFTLASEFRKKTNFQTPLDIFNVMGLALRGFYGEKQPVYVLVTGKDSKDVSSKSGSAIVRI